MAHQEPMDVDCMDSDFDNKENTFHHNVPCTEKGYEELDVSELNMKLRFSMTPASSPMSKSYTACPDNRHFETGDTLNCNENANLTRSLNSAMTKNDNIIKSLKSLPLQLLSTEQFTDGNGNAGVLRQLDHSTGDDTNKTVIIIGENNVDENFSLPSSSSSVLHTPEATTPTKEIKNEASPIMRGLKSVLNMFRSSTSPVPPVDVDNITLKREDLSTADITVTENARSLVVASTPIAAHRTTDCNTAKRSSPYKDSIVFNDDLEKEINWKDEKISSPEKTPIHKLLFQNRKTPERKLEDTDLNSSTLENNFHSFVEDMDVSNNQSILLDKTMTECHPDNHEVSIAFESDSEFVDCETTFSKNESYVLDIKAIQDKISPKLSLVDTKNISCTVKNTEFVDCDSRLSINDSYVLDIKEIQEKITQKSNLDETKDFSRKSKNNFAINQTTGQDVTNMSFGDLDLNPDMTVPSDYSDFSQATANILFELEKLETYDIDIKNHTDLCDNITETKGVTEQQFHKSEDTTKENTLEESILVQQTEATESQENQFNNTEKECDILEATLTEVKGVDIVQSITPEMIDLHDIVMDIAQCTESLVESENKSSQSQEVILPKDNANDGFEVVVENPLHNTSEIHPQETNIIQDFDSIENKNNSIMMISQKSAKAPTEIYSNNVETVPSEILNVMQDNVNSVDILNVIQNNVVPMSIVNSLHKDVATSEALNVTQNDSIVESLHTLHVDLPLPDEAIDQINTMDLLVAQNVTDAKEVQRTDNPSDVPLPDDDVEEEIVVSEVPITTVEMVPDSTSESIITLSESKVTEAVSQALVHTTVGNETSNDSVLNSDKLQAQLSELKRVENTNNVKTLEILSETEIKCNELPELNNLCLTTTNLSSTEIETIDKKIFDTISVKNKIDTGILNEIVPSSIIINNDINENCNVTQIVDDSHNFSNNQSIKTNTDNLTGNQNTSQIEPMDITFNESLNLTHELPDLVNQTIVLAEDNMQNTIIADTVNELKQVELAPIPDNIRDTEHLTASKIQSETKNECAFDFESKINLMEAISASGSAIILEEKNVTNMQVNDGKQPVCGTNNVNVDNVAMNVSHEQPPIVFTNASDSDPIAVEGITIDEEIIESANNSPYVSLMSGVETVQEKNKTAEKIEEPINSEDAEKVNDPIKNEDVFEEIESPFVTKTNVASSPPITSKGYNFNFDEMDDPFATKTKIRLSPPLDTLTKAVGTEKENDIQFKIPYKGVVHRRKSQPLERKKPNTLKKKLNVSFDTKNAPEPSVNKMDNTVLVKEIKDKTNTEETDYIQFVEVAKDQSIETLDATPEEEDNDSKSKDKKELKIEQQTESKVEGTSDYTLYVSEENKTSIDSDHAVSSELKTTSSSEQSTYYSAGASSTESFQSKNVFNLPEIDDVNFNPFTTKSKMRLSPPPDKEIENPFATISKMRLSPPPDTQIDNHFASTSKTKSSPDVSIISHSKTDTDRTVTLDESKLFQSAKHIEGDDKMETELMEKDTSTHITDITSSSKATDDQNLTAREVNTEDEDTIEGPFFDVDDNIEKNTDFACDSDDMMNFNELRETAQTNEDNPDSELFIDAQAFEFLLNKNNSNVVADSGKESLFLKFDPLFAKRMSSGGALASLNKAPKKQSTPTKPSRSSLHNEASPIAGPSNLNVTYEGDNNISQESNEDANITVTKPMMVVTPALNPVVTPRNKSINHVRSNRRSITFTSPAIAVIDRLLSMSANHSVLGHDSSNISTQSNGEQTEADIALTQLRDLLAEKEIGVYNLRSESKELKDRLSTMETQVRILEADGQERLKKINELNERLVEKTKINKGMAAVVEEYERTIASLIADIEQDKKQNAEERIRLINERDEQTAHLASMEVSFSDLHSKYEKSKQVILTCKANEDVFRKTLQDFEVQVTKMQTNYEMLKQHATAKLNHANQELEKINRAHEAEVIKLNAMIKRNHLLATSLQETLAQKTKANDELTAICDELINKVGSNK